MEEAKLPTSQSTESLPILFQKGFSGCTDGDTGQGIKQKY